VRNWNHALAWLGCFGCTLVIITVSAASLWAVIHFVLKYW
jgi:hypothetical protein